MSNIELEINNQSNLPDILYNIFTTILVLPIIYFQLICPILSNNICIFARGGWVISLAIYILPVFVVWFICSVVMILRSFKIKKRGGTSWRIVYYPLLFVVAIILAWKTLVASLIVGALFLYM
jgi:hypothetical protein